MYVKYYNTICNTDVIEYFSNIWEARRCKDMNNGEYVNRKGEPINEQ